MATLMDFGSSKIPWLTDLNRPMNLLSVCHAVVFKSVTLFSCKRFNLLHYEYQQDD